MKKIVSLVLALAMVALCIGAAVADETSQHTITITNTDQNVAHTYEAYQVFKGKLDDTQTKLSDIVWGNGVNGPALLAELQRALPAKFPATVDTAAKVAEVLATFSSTSGESESSGDIDTVAEIISKHLATKAADFSASGTTYTATVTGDGYYFIKDTTTNLEGTNGSDTKSKHLLSVIKNTTIVAKDTHLTPDKEIVEGSARVKEGTAAIGDTVTFEVSIPVPNTKKYVDHFIFDMVDTLPIGLTFTGLTSVKVGDADVANTLTVNGSAFSAPADPVDANAPSAGQTIKVVFNNFKANAEAGNWIGQTLKVTYTAVVNKNADFTPTGNINEVKFDYSNDPNHDYDGDQPGPDEPMGETPDSTTKTVLANIIVNKTDGSNALAGAEFEITSNEYNTTLVTGEKFEKNPYTVSDDETLVSDNWYLLKDGSYTQTTPTDTNRTAYQSDTDTYKKVSFAHFVTTPTGTTKKVTVISGEDGVIKLEGLKPGTYTIQETKAPSGFNLDTTVHTIVISATYDASSKTIALSGTVDGSTAGWSGSTATASITITNQAGTVLPSTGGIGTTIFYILGGVLVIGAAVILVARRKAHD